MSIPSVFLSQRLFQAARTFSSAVHLGGGQSILVGGSACILLGYKDRVTRDLDFNLTVFNDQIKANLHDNGITIKAGPAENRFSVTVPETSPGSLDATSIDCAVKPQDVLFLLPYTKFIEGIRVADERLILVDKVRCFSSRVEQAQGKLENDLKDVLFCVDKIRDSKAEIPIELKKMIDDKTWSRFWERVIDIDSGGYETYKFFIGEIGLSQ